MAENLKGPKIKGSKVVKTQNVTVSLYVSVIGKIQGSGFLSHDGGGERTGYVAGILTSASLFVPIFAQNLDLREIVRKLVPKF